jgi:hypothetical protein
LATCDSEGSRATRADFDAWAKVANRLWVWDYTTDFGNYLLPFPNQRMIGPNIRYFVAHNVKGIFEEDTVETVDSEFAALGGYVMAKCLWNPNYDATRAIDEFLDAYYGRAAGPIRDYIDLLHADERKTNIHANGGALIDTPCLKNELLLKGNALWEDAERRVASEPDVLERVRLSRMSPDYVIVERARFQAQHRMPADAAIMSLAKARFQPFAKTLRRSKLSALAEGRPLDKDAYLRDLAKDLGLSVP